MGPSAPRGVASLRGQRPGAHRVHRGAGGWWLPAHRLSRGRIHQPADGPVKSARGAGHQAPGRRWCRPLSVTSGRRKDLHRELPEAAARLNRRQPGPRRIEDERALEASGRGRGREPGPSTALVPGCWATTLAARSDEPRGTRTGPDPAAGGGEVDLGEGRAWHKEFVVLVDGDRPAQLEHGRAEGDRDGLLECRPSRRVCELVLPRAPIVRRLSPRSSQRG